MEEEIVLTEENDIEEISIEEENYSGKPYVLPIASKDVLGGIKVGKNLTIDEDGTLNAQAGGNNGIVVENDVITVTNKELSVANTDAYSDFELVEKCKIGNSFSIENNAIKIGKGVSKVLLSFGVMLMYPGASGLKYIRLRKNNALQFQIQQNVNIEERALMVHPTVLMEVAEGDLIDMGAYGSQNDYYYSNRGFITIQKVDETTVISGSGTGDVDLTAYAKKEEIKTINGISLIGTGNIVIEGGSGGTTEQTEFVVFGDSWSDLSVPDSIWSTKVATALGLNLHNYAVNGAGFVSPTTNLISTQINTFINSSVDKTKVKYIVLLGGINDYKNSVSYDVLATAVISAINTLKTACPNAKILFSNNIEADYDLEQALYWKNLNKSIRNEVLITTYNMFGVYSNDLFNSNNYCHLTQEGQILLAKNIMACLTGGELISSIDERIFEDSTGKVEYRSELVSSNMAAIDLRFIPKTQTTSYKISFDTSLPRLPYADSIAMLGIVGKGLNLVICDVMRRSIAFASKSILGENNVYTFSIITPLY